ncbi:MAG: sulfatase family protein, partial [Puniceicoccales bacterium]
TVYGDREVETPTFDRIAEKGVLFNHAYVSSPSCTPSRNAILTGQQFFRLESGANLWSELPQKFVVFPHLLEDHGYRVLSSRKIYGPGPNWERRIEGEWYETQEAMNEALLDGKTDGPFCILLGTSDPHRPYNQKARLAQNSHLDPENVSVPSYFPDTPEVRADIADYYFEVERFDSDVARQLQILDEMGELDNTIVIMTGDHGWPFPRAKSNLYDIGTRVPLAIMWGKNVQNPGRVIEDFVSLTDIAPTVLQAANIQIPESMTGRSLIPLLETESTGWIDPERNFVITGKERHTPAQADSMEGTPMRAIRTQDYLYIRNFKPESWPAGSPKNPKTWPYSDIDGGRTKDAILAVKDDPEMAFMYELSMGKRPADELYRIDEDPEQIHNLADDPEYAETVEQLRTQLMEELVELDDPRALGNGDSFT